MTTQVANELAAVSPDGERALAGCERYWRRLRGEEPTPDMAAAMVLAAVEMLPKLVPDHDKSPAYVSLAVPGVIDTQLNHVPHADYVDPWGNQYSLEVHSTRQARAMSAGPDGEFGTSDDIGFPSRPEPLVRNEERKR
jgi:hypothetical protein